MLDPRAVAHKLGGSVNGRNVIAPGPGHSPADRSLAVRFDPNAPEGFSCHSFAGDDWRECRDYVRCALGLSALEGRRRRWVPYRPTRAAAVANDDAGGRTAFALRLWNEARDSRGTVVTKYLASRDLTLPEDVAGDVIRFHPALNFEGSLVGAMGALFRDVASNKPCGIHRTFLDAMGRKLGRKMLGRARSAAIKLDADANVTLGLHLGEGLETCLAARLAGFRPVWALGSAGAIGAFPVLPGIEAVTILVEVGDGGANLRATQACAARWIEAGREAFNVVPLVGSDLNDVWRVAVRCR
jgi:putative DNA primase/helicase